MGMILRTHTHKTTTSFRCNVTTGSVVSKFSGHRPHEGPVTATIWILVIHLFIAIIIIIIMISICNDYDFRIWIVHDYAICGSMIMMLIYYVSSFSS